MNLETRKSNLIDWIANMPNEGLIEYLELLKNRDNDSLDEILDEAQIISGLTDEQINNELGNIMSPFDIGRNN